MAKLRSNSTKNGRGKHKKSLAGCKSDSVMRNSEVGLKNVEKEPIVIRSPDSDGVHKKSLMLTKGIITRSGRIRKRNKDQLKVMDNILKSELLIDVNRESPKELQSSPVSNGNNNNNDFAISNQNKTVSFIDQSNQDKRKRQTRQNTKNVPLENNNNNASEVIGKITVAKNIFIDSGGNIKKDLKKKKSTPVNKSDSKRPSKENDKSTKKPQRMDKAVREDVLKTMKSALSLENNITNKNSGKAKNPSKKNSEKSKNEDKAKTKQVRLSNGVVLTLSLVECDVCNKTFSNKASLSRHMFAHFDLKHYQCRKCPRKFRHRDTLKIHMLKRHQPPGKEVQYYVCQICHKAFQMEENLAIHLTTHVKTENNFKCLYCEKKFSHRLMLLQHEKTHLDTGRYKCFVCEMTYDTRSRLSNHIKTHSRVKDYICHYCGKEFVRLNSIKRHVRVCHGGFRVECPICFKTLKGHLTEHMRTHEQNKPHVCQDCGQCFTQATQLRVHGRSHTGVRPYGCKICKHKFSHSNALMLHIRRHTGEKPFPCAMCPMTFSQLPHMKAHMRKIHNKDNAYKCGKCASFFKFKAELGSHVKTCSFGDRDMTYEEKIQASIQSEEIEVDCTQSLTKMRFQLALLLSMIASKDRLKILGFNKRLIDDLLEESLEAMGHEPCQDETISPLQRLRTNIDTLLEGTVPKHQMEKFRSENKSTEDLLMLLTDDKRND